MAGVLVVVLGVLVFVAVRRPAPYDPYRVCHYVKTTDPVTGRQVRIADPEVAQRFGSANYPQCVDSTARYPGHDWHSTPVEGVTGGTFGTSPQGELFARDSRGRLVEVTDIGSDPVVTRVGWANGEPVPAVRENAYMTVFHDSADVVHVLYESDGAGLVHVVRGPAGRDCHTPLGSTSPSDTVCKTAPGPYTAEILDPEPFPWRSAAMVERGDGYHVFWNSIRDDDRDRQRIMWANGVAGGLSPPRVVQGSGTSLPVPGMRAGYAGAIAATTLGDTIHVFYTDFSDYGRGLFRVSLGPGTSDWVGPFPFVPDCAGYDCYRRSLPVSLARSLDPSDWITVGPDSPLFASTVPDPDSAEGRPLVVVAGGSDRQGLLMAVFAQGAAPTDLTLVGERDGTVGSRYGMNRCLNEYPVGDGALGWLLEVCTHQTRRTPRNHGLADFTGLTSGHERENGPTASLAVLVRDGRFYTAFGYGGPSGDGIGLLVRERDWPVEWRFRSDFFLEHHRGDRVGTGWPVGLVPAGDTGIAIVAIPHETDPVTGEDRTKPLTITCTACDA